MGRTYVLRVAGIILIICLCSALVCSQDLSGIEIHGFATQGLLYSTHNNYLTTESSSGSLQWTQGAISVTDSVTDNLRVGIQLRMYQLGQLGGPNIQVDWALGDYRINDMFGIRAGKVKTVYALFNDSQDLDSVFLWSFLPECSYPVDNESFYLSHLGGDVYGTVPLGKRAGKLRYDGYIGEVYLDLNGGYAKQASDEGINFTSAPSGKTYGGDLRWQPVSGLTVGASAFVEGLDGSAPGATLHVAPFTVVGEYAQFVKGKWYFGGEHDRAPFDDVFTTPEGVLRLPIDARSWFAMTSYRLSRKLQVGTYYGHFVNEALDTSLPSNYLKDWALSSRYDFNSYFYAKLEDHFMHGYGLGFYDSTNPGGYKPNSNILAAKVGFSF